MDRRRSSSVRCCWIYCSWCAFASSSSWTKLVTCSKYRQLSLVSAFSFAAQAKRITRTSTIIASPRRLAAWLFSARSCRNPMSSSSKSDADFYNEIVSSSVDLSNAHLSTNGVLTVTRSVRDIDNNKKRRFLYTILVPTVSDNKGDNKEVTASHIILPPTEYHDNIKLRLVSSSGNKIAIFRHNSPADSKLQHHAIEIWNGSCLSQRIVVSSPDNPSHGSILFDAGGFGQPSWSQDEQFLLYAAERNPIKTKSFFAASTLQQQEKNDKGEQDFKKNIAVVGGASTFGIGKLEGWGEKYTQQSPLFDLFLLHTGTGRVGRIENVPSGRRDGDALMDDGITLGQAVLSPSLTHVVYTAWHATSTGAADNSDDDDKGLVRMSRRFGMIYCQQRPCRLFASPIDLLVQRLSFPTPQNATTTKDSGYVCLTPNHRVAFSPRFAPFNSESEDALTYPMVFLSSEKYIDTHSVCFALSTLQWNEKNGPVLTSLKVVVDQVMHPNVSNKVDEMSENNPRLVNLSFPGLFVQQLPEFCFLPNLGAYGGLSILVVTQWGSVQRIIRIELATGKVSVFPFQLIDKDTAVTESHASQSLLAITKNGGVIIAESAPNQPFVLACLSPSQVQNCDKASSQADEVNAIRFSPIVASACLSSSLTGLCGGPLGISYQVINMVPPPIGDTAVDDKSFPLQCILMRPPSSQHGQKFPLGVMVHGGPHSCFSTSFVPSFAFLCASGYALLLVNYRGSTGFGQAGMDILRGRIGTLDVQDTVFCTQTVLQQNSDWIRGDRIGIVGGSHGGFITGHVIGQFPKMFQVAAMRNPVTNIASMVTTTDLPDWCHVETNASSNYDWTRFKSPTLDQLTAMYAKSPVAHVEKVVTPTLVALGLKDQRVPPSQGMEFYYTLRANGVKTKLLLYDDSDHAIDMVASEADHWLNIKRWLDEHLLME